MTQQPQQKRIGFTCGAADLWHPGHCLMVEEAKQVCDYLIFGLHTDPTIDRPGVKNQPVQSIEERRILVRSNRHIDEIWEYDTEAQLIEYLTKNARCNGGRIDVRIIGMDYFGKNFSGRDIGIVIHYNSRSHDYSTTNLRRRVHAAEEARLERESERLNSPELAHRKRVTLIQGAAAA